MDINEFLTVAKQPERLVNFHSDGKVRRISSYTYELGVYDNYCILTTLSLDELFEGMQQKSFVSIPHGFRYVPGTVAAYPKMTQKDSSADALYRFYQDNFTNKIMFHVHGDTPKGVSQMQQFADSIREVYELLVERQASFCSPSVPWKFLEDPNYKVRIDDLVIRR